ncbi:ParB N-terminal domain-containing protein [Tuwongella immobilis]|uniref:ParB/Sulfiredoxin domain-containing protein n=1 Tax=Tuwongella immobilis TaxID=692036 RepID=A0A6C2YHZ6_9BACT|nr:hypothetical protein [Tuwongella immobilis]VIP00685.1 Uncharacterized protein OS=Planctomyces maris DSM 8797 GN=PM8797T_10214 PE=4 SV=1 [Tuwongella immobilis]VTR96788.1 Uncharacterized protein OS=Planctomyces maris DSM 8797 GN=PM8797T_10214 PE=4 SV=1 [Tuwongella immobilis]
MTTAHSARPLRNRIREHRLVQARDLLPHPLNWRTHPASQRQSLQAVYDEIGMARSLLAYQRADGQLQLIDGHLRRELTPDAEVMVEILDVTDAEAEQLLLIVDPLAALAGRDDAVLQELHAAAQTDSAILQALFDAVVADCDAPVGAPIGAPVDADSDRDADCEADCDQPPLRDQFLILITCESESQQSDWLDRLSAAGLSAKALLGFGLAEEN